MASFVKLTDELVVQRERIISVTPISPGWSRVHLETGGAAGPTSREVQLSLDELFAKLEVPVIREETDDLELLLNLGKKR
ncbi:MAG TPA: hypothetical protein VFH56_02950 [Acidimicrobiales bacterium]|nr:hypothetical protein [Acidimicrobiales bacterium]